MDNTPPITPSPQPETPSVITPPVQAEAKSKHLVLIIVSVLVLVLIGGSVYFFFFRPDKSEALKKSVDEPTVDETNETVTEKAVATPNTEATDKKPQLPKIPAQPASDTTPPANENFVSNEDCDQNFALGFILNEGIDIETAKKIAAEHNANLRDLWVDDYDNNKVNGSICIKDGNDYLYGGKENALLNELKQDTRFSEAYIEHLDVPF